MFRFFRRMPIKRQLMVLACSTAVIVFSVIMFTYFQISNVIADNNLKYTNDFFMQNNTAIVEKCNLVGHILQNLSYNNSVQNFLMEQDKYKRYSFGLDVSTMMINMQDMNSGILDILIKAENGNSLYLHGTATDLKDQLSTLPKQRINNYYTETRTLQINGRPVTCFIVATTIVSIQSEKLSGQAIGTTIVVLDAESLGLGRDDRLNSAGPTFFYLLDRNNKVYSSNTNDLTLFNKFSEYTKYKDGNYITSKLGQKYYISKEAIPQTGGQLISIAPQKLLLKELSWMQKLTFVILITAAILLSFPFLLITNNILRPVKKLVSFINCIKKGDLNLLKKRLELDGFEEIEIMSVEFNNMLDKIDQLTQGLVSKSTMLFEAELAKKQSELAYLKSQINPHFLYNTLEVMKGSAYDEGAERTAGMAKSLAQIFRYSVKGENMVTLREEINIIKSYVQIQQMRFDNKFDVIYEFTNEALSCRMPKMLLQPIVENAVFHGLEAKMDKGLLKIQAYVNAVNDLVVIVEDDGMGIDEDILNEINSNLKNKKTDVLENTSIGIFNVNNRIKLTYGDAYGISVESVAGKGTKVVLKIPVGEALD